MTHDLRYSSLFSIHLNEGEKLIWTGRPRDGFRFEWFDLFLIPFSMAWCGFAMLWEGLAIYSGNWLFILFGIPFVLLGFQLMIGRFFTDRKRRRNLYYAFSTRRVLFLNTDPKKGWLHFIPLDAIREVIPRPKADGHGKLLFRSDRFEFSGFKGYDLWGNGSFPYFEMLDEVTSIARLLQNEMKSSD